MSSTLERAAIKAWREWSLFQKTTRCSRCGTRRYCGARHASGPWVCVDCHDLIGLSS